MRSDELSAETKKAVEELSRVIPDVFSRLGTSPEAGILAVHFLCYSISEHAVKKLALDPKKVAIMGLLGLREFIEQNNI